MPQGQGTRLRARRRRVLLSHGRPLFPQKGPKSAIATWNLRRLGTGNWGETSWLKMKMLTRIALLPTKRDVGFVGGAIGCLDLLPIVQGTSGSAWTGLRPMLWRSRWLVM